jgi:hypothetical protein
MLALAGCSAATPAAQTTAAPAPAAAPSSAAPAPTPTTPTAAPLGSTVTTKAGLALTVTLVGPMPAKGFIAPFGDTGAHFSGRTAVFKTTLHNGTTAPIDASMFAAGQPIVLAGSDGSQVPSNSWDARPLAMVNWPSVQPGQTYSWEWGVDDGKGISGATVQYNVTLPEYQGGSTTMQWTGNVP